MIKILSVGNSFSQDAHAHLHQLAKSSNIDVLTVNLMIGGCSLKTHWENVIENAVNYDFEQNGEFKGRKISIKEALESADWDFITLQQASHDSGILETYYPYIKELSDYVKAHAPKATQYIHQTWAYETDSTHGGFASYGNNQAEMYSSLTAAYQHAANTLGLNIIPSGRVIQELRKTPEFNYEKGGQSLCRDGFHMSLCYGRYAVAATWYEVLLKENILNNSFLPPEEEGPVDINKINIIKNSIHKSVNLK